MERLHRIKTNGVRKELPCWIELQVKHQRDTLVFVSHPAGNSRNCSERILYGKYISVIINATVFCHACQQAANIKEAIDVSVTLTDNRKISLQLDSASTSAEVCQSVAHLIGLKDTYGFSLYISLFDKVITSYRASAGF